MIEVQRAAPTRILKQRDLQAGSVIRPALESVDAASQRTVPPGAEAPSRCTTKEARIVAGDNGAQAIEVRCSCGEWTRVELQVANAAMEKQ